MKPTQTRTTRQQTLGAGNHTLPAAYCISYLHALCQVRQSTAAHSQIWTLPYRFHWFRWCKTLLAARRQFVLCQTSNSYNAGRTLNMSSTVP